MERDGEMESRRTSGLLLANRLQDLAPRRHTSRVWIDGERRSRGKSFRGNREREGGREARGWGRQSFSAERSVAGWARERNAETVDLAAVYCFIYEERYEIGFTLGSVSVYPRSQHNPARNQNGGDQRKTTPAPSPTHLYLDHRVILSSDLIIIYGECTDEKSNASNDQQRIQPSCSTPLIVN